MCRFTGIEGQIFRYKRGLALFYKSVIGVLYEDQGTARAVE